MNAARSRVKALFGPDSLDWLDRSYAVDWLVTISLWLLSGVPDRLPVFEREFSVDDPVINHPHTKQQISGTTNHRVALYIPLLVVLLVGGFRRSLLEMHHGALAAFAGRGLSRLITEFLKNRVGRLRPDFLARCKWNAITRICAGKADDLTDGRRSFPSGHSSAAWAGMAFLSLWFAGKTAAFCFSAPTKPVSLWSSRMLAFSLTVSPLFWAAWVALSRVEDYRHHKEDVIVGSLIGALSAWITYSIYWPSPFALQSFAHGSSGEAKALYANSEHDRVRDDFELTRLEEDDFSGDHV